METHSSLNVFSTKLNMGEKKGSKTTLAGNCERREKAKENGGSTEISLPETASLVAMSAPPQGVSPLLPSFCQSFMSSHTHRKNYEIHTLLSCCGIAVGGAHEVVRHKHPSV